MIVTGPSHVGRAVMVVSVWTVMILFEVVVVVGCTVTINVDLDAVPDVTVRVVVKLVEVIVEVTIDVVRAVTVLLGIAK